jgi:hypothetical protein
MKTGPSRLRPISSRDISPGVLVRTVADACCKRRPNSFLMSDRRRQISWCEGDMGVAYETMNLRVKCRGSVSGTSVIPRDLGDYEIWPNNCESSERD